MTGINSRLLRWLQQAVGIAAETAVVTFLPAWAVWLLNEHAGQPLPIWSWVVLPAVIDACLVRQGMKRTPSGGPADQG
jgi:hypothetical protein